jgi:hypothetical protein
VVITSRYYESSGEILWQVAPQTRPFRWFNEDWEEVVWLCGEAGAVHLFAEPLPSNDKG